VHSTRCADVSGGGTVLGGMSEMWWPTVQREVNACAHYLFNACAHCLSTSEDGVRVSEQADRMYGRVERATDRKIDFNMFIGNCVGTRK